MKFILLSSNIIKYLIIGVSVIFMGIIIYYGDKETIGDHTYVKFQEEAEEIVTEIDENWKDERGVGFIQFCMLSENSNLTKKEVKDSLVNEQFEKLKAEYLARYPDNVVDKLIIFARDKVKISEEADTLISKGEIEESERDEYIEGKLHKYEIGPEAHISKVIIQNFLYVALFSIIILTLFSIGIGSSIGALFSFILLYWGEIDYGNIPYLTNGDLAILNDGINDSSVMNLFQTIMVIMTLMMIGDIIEKIIKKRRDLIFSRLKMIIPLGLILLISYSLAINTSSSNPTTVKFVESEGEILPENATEYDNLTSAEQTTWAQQEKIIRYTDIVINWDHVEIVEKKEMEEEMTMEEVIIANQVIALNEAREKENMVGIGIWSFYILLSISIIFILITELSSTKVGRVLSSKLEFILSSISRKFSR